MYIKGEDTITSDANANDVKAALSMLDFLVVQDVNFSETARFANVILPASPSLEKEGTFTSTERRIQRLYRAFEPLGQSKPDWEIIQDIANRLGAGWNYSHPSEIMEECAALTPMFAGVRYDRLEGYKSLQWPVEKNGKDSPLLFTEKFPFPDGKAKFHPIEWIEPCEEKSAEFNHHLNNGRLLEHFEQGSMTYRSAGIREITPTNFVEVSPELAAQAGTGERQRGPPAQPLRRSDGPGRGHRSRGGRPTLYAAELHHPAGQSPHRIKCGQRHAHARLQRDFRQHDGPP